MIIARSLHEIDTTDRRTWSAAAIAPHRGDVTTVMAAAAVRARAAARVEGARASGVACGTGPLARAERARAASGREADFDLL